MIDIYIDKIKTIAILITPFLLFLFKYKENRENNELKNKFENFINLRDNHSNQIVNQRIKNIEEIREEGTLLVEMLTTFVRITVKGKELERDGEELKEIEEKNFILKKESILVGHLDDMRDLNTYQEKILRDITKTLISLDLRLNLKEDFDLVNILRKIPEELYKKDLNNLGDYSYEIWKELRKVIDKEWKKCKKEIREGK